MIKEIRFADGNSRPLPSFMDMETISPVTKAELLAEITGQVVEIIHESSTEEIL